MRRFLESAPSWDNVDSSYYRTEAERCRWLAVRADPDTVSILLGLAASYDAKAARLGSEERVERPKARRAG